MEVEFKHSPDHIMTVHLTGRMDIAGTQDAEGPITANVLDKDFARVVIDLSNVDYMASVGLGSLVRTAQAVERRKGRLVMLNPQPLVAKLLKESGVWQHIHVFNTMAEAEHYLGRLPEADE